MLSQCPAHTLYQSKVHSHTCDSCTQEQKSIQVVAKEITDSEITNGFTKKVAFELHFEIDIVQTDKEQTKHKNNEGLEKH